VPLSGARTERLHSVHFSLIDLLKVDIEGAEIEVFGACPWITKVRAIAIELHDRIRPGCTSVVKTAARDMRCDEHGEVTFFVREEDTFRYSADLLAGKSAEAGSTAA
jgi:hypothetical protein